ncbi:MAG: hypothetical protein V1790_13655, partial [Planctomycetota bacterium]
YIYYIRYHALVKPQNECESAPPCHRERNCLSRHGFMDEKKTYLRNRWTGRRVPAHRSRAESLAMRLGLAVRENLLTPTAHRIPAAF